MFECVCVCLSVWEGFSSGVCLCVCVCVCMHGVCVFEWCVCMRGVCVCDAQHLHPIPHPIIYLVCDSHTYLVCSIICRPKDVTLDDISKQGILPTVAPVKPYTLLALT